MCKGFGGHSFVCALDQHATEAGQFLSAATFSADCLTYVHTHLFAIACVNICGHVNGPFVHVSSGDYGNTKTPSMHRRLGNTTLLQLAFPGKSNPNFLWEESEWDNTVVKKTTTNLLTYSLRCQKLWYVYMMNCTCLTQSTQALSSPDH